MTEVQDSRFLKFFKKCHNILKLFEQINDSFLFKFLGCNAHVFRLFVEDRLSNKISHDRYAYKIPNAYAQSYSIAYALLRNPIWCAICHTKYGRTISFPITIPHFGSTLFETIDDA